MTLKHLHPTYIGFNQLIEAMNSNQIRQDDGYPKYNIISIDEDNTCIQLALAGFTMEDLDIQVEQRELTITGNSSISSDLDYIHKGISTKNFKRVFHLAEYIEVKSANLENGILSINLVRKIPDNKKPRKIEIRKPQLLLED